MMECNKDEAVRAKSIAEFKLEKNDFAGAITFAVKAQTLYPGLDGISQMLATLEVHVSAAKKMNGHVDWYGVLRVDPTADDETIKKHYKKLALILHPDKNESSGADGAFKLISEAKSLLLDKDKRTAYDLITGRQESFQHKIPPPADTIRPSTGPDYTSSPCSGAGGTCARTGDPPAYSRDQPGIWDRAGVPSAHTRGPSESSGTKQASKPQRRSDKTARFGRAQPPKRADMFWTVCHHCGMQFEYLKIYRNTILLCPNCNKAFMSLEIPQPIGRSRSHKPKPWPPHQHNPSHKGSRTPDATGEGKKAVNVRKSRSWETSSSSCAYTTYKQAPFEPSMATNAAYYSKPSGLNVMSGSLKKRKLDDCGGICGHNYTVAQEDVNIGKLNTLRSGLYGFAGRCNA
ncbi:hypothetical protein OROGR_016077 [Orobanche gracilis]